MTTLLLQTLQTGNSFVNLTVYNPEKTIDTPTGMVSTFGDSDTLSVLLPLLDKQENVAEVQLVSL